MKRKSLLFVILTIFTFPSYTQSLKFHNDNLQTFSLSVSTGLFIPAAFYDNLETGLHFDVEAQYRYGKQIEHYLNAGVNFTKYPVMIWLDEIGYQPPNPSVKIIEIKTGPRIYFGESGNGLLMELGIGDHIFIHDKQSTHNITLSFGSGWSFNLGKRIDVLPKFDYNSFAADFASGYIVLKIGAKYKFD